MPDVWHTVCPVCSLACHWQIHLPDAELHNAPSFFCHWQTHFQMPLLYTQVQYHCGTGGSYVVKPNKTQTSLRIASLLGRASSSRSGGHEFEFPVWRELSALTKVGRSLESGLSTVVNPNMIKSCLTCSTLSVRCAAWHVTGRFTCLMLNCIMLPVFFVTGRLTFRCHFSTPKCSTIVVPEGAM